MFNLIAGVYGNGNISDIEILWTLIALIGGLFSIYNVNQARKDKMVLKAKGIRNGRMQIALTGFRVEVGRACVQALYLTIGILAMTYKEPPVGDTKTQVVRFIVQWSFILSSLILVFNSYLNFKLRRGLIEHGIKLEPHENDSPIS